MSAALDNLVRPLGGKRFALALLVVACGLGARALAWIDGAQLVDLLKYALGLYGAANIGGRATDAIRAAIAARARAGAAP